MDYSYDYEWGADDVGSVLGYGALGVLGFFFMIAKYVYFSLTWMNIAKKLNYKNSWLAWVPFGRTVLILQLGGFPWALVFLWLLPVIGWIAIWGIRIAASWKIYEKRKYPPALSLLNLIDVLIFLPYASYISTIANGIVLGFVGWKDKEGTPAEDKAPEKPETPPTPES